MRTPPVLSVPVPQKPKPWKVPLVFLMGVLACPVLVVVGAFVAVLGDLASGKTSLSPPTVTAARKLRSLEPIEEVSGVLGVSGRPFGPTVADPETGRPIRTVLFSVGPGDPLITAFYMDDYTLCDVKPDPGNISQP